MLINPLSSCTGLSELLERAVKIANATMIVVAMIFGMIPEAIAQESPSSLREAYGDWSVSCRKVKGEEGVHNSSCQLTQELRDKKTG